MAAMNFPTKVLRWVQECVTTAHYTINMNGVLEGHFKGIKGLRQRDPISPYLFLLIMEAFSCILKTHIQSSSFQFHPKCENLQVSHVCFVDDLFLLSAANVESVNVLKQTLEEFN